MTKIKAIKSLCLLCPIHYLALIMAGHQNMDIVVFCFSILLVFRIRYSTKILSIHKIDT